MARHKFVDPSNPQANVSSVPTSAPAKKLEQKKTFSLEEFIKNRDYVGAISFLEFEKKSGQSRIVDIDLWLAYAYVHSGDFPKALEIYNTMLVADPYNSDLLIYKAICLYGCANFHEALNVAQSAREESSLKHR